MLDLFRAAAIALGITLPVVAYAGGSTGNSVLDFALSAHIIFDWPSTVKCANEPLPKEPEPYAHDPSVPVEKDTDRFIAWYRAEQAWENALNRIVDCRAALAARHEGWIAANPNKPDPLDPAKVEKP